MIKESQIIHENGAFWVFKSKGLYVVMKNGVTHSTQVGDCGWADKNLAIAYCDYQAKTRERLKMKTLTPAQELKREKAKNARLVATLEEIQYKIDNSVYVLHEELEKSIARLIKRGLR